MHGMCPWDFLKWQNRESNRPFFREERKSGKIITACMAGKDNLLFLLLFMMMSNSLLFCGPEEVGKRDRALVLAKALSCQRRKDDACEACAAGISRRL